MALPPLLDFTPRLDDFYGGPFALEAVEVASATLRAAAGWHIAPEVTETLTVDGGGSRLLLPTLKLVSVAEVRRLDSDGTSTILEDWRLSSAGVLYRAHGWPEGFQCIEVDVVHGYDECPPELLPVLAAACRDQASDLRLQSRARGPFSESYRNEATVDDPALARHTLPPRC